MLKKVSVLDADKYSLVRWYECFMHLGHLCVAFEMLDRSLLTFMMERHLKPLPLHKIRPITQQVHTHSIAMQWQHLELLIDVTVYVICISVCVHAAAHGFQGSEDHRCYSH